MAVAYGVDDHSKTTRNLGIPLERLLSVFASLMGLFELKNGNESSLQSMGNTMIGHSLSSLVELGVLQPTVPDDHRRLRDARFSCNLTATEARKIADNLDIDNLDSFLLA